MAHAELTGRHHANYGSSCSVHPPKSRVRPRRVKSAVAPHSAERQKVRWERTRLFEAEDVFSTARFHGATIAGPFIASTHL